MLGDVCDTKVPLTYPDEIEMNIKHSLTDRFCLKVALKFWNVHEPLPLHEAFHEMLTVGPDVSHPQFQ